MMSEGSRDTEDWSNGWWKLSFAITGKYIKYIKYIKIENVVIVWATLVKMFFSPWSKAYLL